MHGNDIRYTAPAGVALSKDAAASSAVTNSDDQLGVRNCVIGAFQCFFHVDRNWSCDQQHVGMSRAGDEFDSSTFEVVAGIVERLKFQFAAVTGAGIHMANAERATEHFANVFVLAVKRGRHWRARREWFGQDAGAQHE